MPITTVTELIGTVKTTLLEDSADGIRWKNSELITYLNEAYKAIVSLKPDASTVNESIALVAGTKQAIPSNGIRLIDVVRNTAVSSRSISIVDSRQLDNAEPNWHSSVATGGIEQYVYDELDPKHFYVYPGATTSNQIEIVYSTMPGSHAIVLQAIPVEAISIDDNYVPVLINYVLYKAFDKDAGDSVNMQRADMYLNRFTTLLTGNAQSEMATSPNAG